MNGCYNKLTWPLGSRRSQGALLCRKTEGEDQLQGCERPAKMQTLHADLSKLPVCCSGCTETEPVCVADQAGALELESAELRFETSAECRAEVHSKQAVPTMALVAEMMIWANSAVAERTGRAFPGAALLRRHPPPRPEAFQEVAQTPASPGN